MSEEENKAGSNKSNSKDTGNSAPPSSSPPLPQPSQYFDSLVTRTLISNQGGSSIFRISSNLYNLPMMKPVLTPDMIPFGSITSRPYAQSPSRTDAEGIHYAADGISSSMLNSPYLKPKAGRVKDTVTTTLGPHDNNGARGLQDEHSNDNNNHHTSSDKVSFGKKILDKKPAGKEGAFATHENNMEEGSNNSLAGNQRAPAEVKVNFPYSTSPEVARLRKSERSAHVELAPAKLRQPNIAGKNERPIDVTIHIGRIEVKAVHQEKSHRSTHSFDAASNQIAPATGSKSAPKMTLNEYLKKRAEGKY
jgi:hypothetical protein